jgi:hypothetical protein
MTLSDSTKERIETLDEISNQYLTGSKEDWALVHAKHALATLDELTEEFKRAITDYATMAASHPNPEPFTAKKEAFETALTYLNELNLVSRRHP